MKNRKTLIIICAVVLALAIGLLGFAAAKLLGGGKAPAEDVQPDVIPERTLHYSANGIETMDNGYMRSDLTSLEIARLMGNGINLGNTMEACDSNVGNCTDDPSYYEKSWGAPITTQEMISGMKAAGFDSIRIPVAWMTNATHLDKGDYTISEAYLDRVEEIINYALNEDMYVIVNDHWDGGWYGMFGSEDEATREFAMEAYKGMWTQIANRYKEYSDYLIFEGANEEIGARFNENSALYCDDSTYSRLDNDNLYKMANEVNQAFVDAVRATGGNNETRFLLIPGYGTNIDNTCDDRFVMPTDTAGNHLLISVHFYDPWNYCGDGQSTVKWGTKTDLETMNATLAKMEKFTNQGYGVVIGEYGVLHVDELQENTIPYHQNFLYNCDIYGYTSCLWDCSGFFIRNELRMIDDEFAAIYTDNCNAARVNTSEEDVKTIATRKMAKLIDAAPDSFREDTLEVTPDSAIAWIMWTDYYSCIYSVGDKYNPDDISAGTVPTDVYVTGEGTYTVALDFTGTEQGFSNGLQFAALGIFNGDILYPGYVIDIQECLINGEHYDFIAKPYTTSDDQKCTRVNLYNGWVLEPPAGIRTVDGSTDGCSAAIIDPTVQVETIEITFNYVPGK